MKEPISIKEILAVVIKRGMAIICVALVFAMLLGGLKGFQQLRTVKGAANTQQQVDARNEAAQKDYQAQYDLAQSTLEKIQYKLEKQQEYNAESLLMQIDPYNKYKSYVILALTEVDTNAFQQVYEQEGTPVDYIVEKILNQYMVYWKHLDLLTALENNPYPDINEKYIREIANVSETDGGTITISVNAQTSAEASMLCQSIYENLLQAQETIQEATYAHKLTLISSGTKLEVDHSIDEKQMTNLEQEDAYKQELLEIETAMKKLKKPSAESVQTMGSVVTVAVKWAVIGGVLGFLMSCVCVWLLYILRDGVETSRQAEAILEAPFLGSVAARGGIFRRLANWLVEERRWKDQEQAGAYIAERMKSCLDGNAKIALVSTTHVSEEDAGIQMLLKTMTQLGHTVVYANEAQSNPKALAAIRECGLVIQAERLGVSNRNAMLYIADVAKQLDAAVLGFVTV